jgi:1-acyl-sn-glycerol-3-phosphate acyltransferase
MLRFLPEPVQGAVIMLLFILNTIFWATPLYVMVLLKLLTPKGALRDRISGAAAWLAQHWAVVNTLMSRLFMRITWDIRQLAQVSPRGQYLVCSNHQTWNDIFVLMHVFGRRAPFFKFFIKQQLIWVPVLGLAWWGLDFPFMKRYTKEQVAKNPALKGKDLETTRKACEAFKNQPALVLNFLEGTRFTQAKRDRQQSPFRHLLKPKSGGFAFTISALGERLSSLLDVTIVYPDGAVGFWDFTCGRMRKVIVEIRPLQVPQEFFEGDYENDGAFRARFQDWIATLWTRKDQRIDELLAEARAHP